MQLDQWSNGIGKHIVKIEDGKNVVGNFRGSVTRFYQHWVNNRGSICPGREVCNLCSSANEEDRKATGRFRINFILKEGNVPMIFEAGKRVYEQMAQLNKDVPLEKAWVRISRTGTKNNTQYMLSIVPGANGLLNAAEEKAVLSVPLHDLRLDKQEEEELEEAPF